MTRLCIVSLLVLAGATPSWSAPPRETGLSVEAKSVAEGNSLFAFDLYARLRSEKPANLFFSPYSISTALAMTDAGARGQTELEMSKVLRFPVPQDKLGSAFAHLRNTLIPKEEKPGFQLRVANRLWGQQGFHFQPAFLQVTKNDYGAELGLVDFKKHTEGARKEINAWVEEQTEKKIKDLLAPGVLTPDSRLVLTNAIYFKARWMNEFGKGATADAPFHVSAEKQNPVPMMHQTHRFSYGESEDLQVLEIPYGPGNIGMLILLPKKNDGLSELEKELTSENVTKWSAGLKPRQVKLSLPKFKMTADFSLGEVLKSMGMKLAFSDNADFTGMSTEEPLTISAVIHKAFVDVNEEGTEAAAATAVIIARATAILPNPEEPVEFRADHPYVFLLRDRQTGSILFMGRLANPKE